MPQNVYGRGLGGGVFYLKGSPLMFDAGFMVRGKVVFDIRRDTEGGSWGARRGRRGGGDSRVLAPS